MDELIPIPPINVISLDRAKEVINQLKSLDLKNASKKEVAELIRELKQHVAIIHTIPKGTVICRSISCDFLGGEYPTKVSQISYNPNLESCGYNRASWQNETVFYGCIQSNLMKSYEASHFEIIGDFVKNGKQIDNTLLVSGKWILQKDLQVVLITGDLKQINHVSASRKATFLNYIVRDKENVLTHKLIDSFLCSEFSKDVPANEKWQYKTSATYADLVKNDNWPALYYPSVQSVGAGMNIAIFPDYVDNNVIVLEQAVGVKFYKRGINVINEYVMEAFPDKGILRWKETYKYKLHPTIRAYYLGKTDYNPLSNKIEMVDLGK